MRSILPTSVLLLIASTLSAGELAPPVRLVADDIPNAAPFFADLDGDGKQDLLVGQFRDDPHTGAKARLYRNIGTTAAPVFAEPTIIQAGNVDAACDEFCYTGFGPQLIDFNGDGKLDLVTGSRDCELFVFAGLDNGTFAEAKELKYVADHRNSRFRYNSRLYVHDWDRDGDLDLIAARYQGIWLFENQGTSESPTYAAPVELVGMGDDKLTLRVAAVADWDHDGNHDLIVGRGDGSVCWYRNSSDAGMPTLASPQVLVEAGVRAYVEPDANGNYTAPATPTEDIRLCVADFNNDGHLDLIVGDNYRKIMPRRTDQQKQAYQVAYDHYSKLRGQLVDVEKIPTSETAEENQDREATIVALREASGKAWRLATGGYNRHGSVWLYQRLPITD